MCLYGLWGLLSLKGLIGHMGLNLFSLLALSVSMASRVFLAWEVCLILMIFMAWRNYIASHYEYDMYIYMDMTYDMDMTWL